MTENYKIIAAEWVKIRPKNFRIVEGVQGEFDKEPGKPFFSVERYRNGKWHTEFSDAWSHTCTREEEVFDVIMDFHRDQFEP
jgi:hypothetical protein